MWFENIEILLASKSPRRKSLLSSLNIPIQTIDIDADESIDTSIPTDQIAETIAIKKASAYCCDTIKENQVLITADTLVVFNDIVMGKPQDKQIAMEMLQRLSGQRHEVYTGVCMRSKRNQFSFTECSHVHFKNLSSEEIEYYIDTYKPYDKAGAYGIQEWIGMVGVEKIEGCYYNIVGLPIVSLYHHLKNFIQ